MSFGDFVWTVLFTAMFFAVGMWAMFYRGWTTLAAICGLVAAGGVLGIIWTILAWLVNVSA
ncbi:MULTISPECIES: hypothetical protein [Rhodococcus]|uniref:hypothetical protein n=1 Tax=Rhodococcus TaxID=1827 RepID=UPI0014440CE1|nr:MULTISPECIES: hypothetical protein [Rhodococcus]MDI9960696.1 hypothetical protein [Rhodococcus sp. IEGM 1237]MDI9966676.1 hypothetical protein [Rhodococcus sp. IEGM 1251]MDV8129146.1 hypothetical protein [Rhodococcus sp. IEGM 1304]